MKKLITLLILTTGMVCTVSATEIYVYLKPGSDWAADNARFDLYYFGGSDPENGWIEFELYDSENGVYRTKNKFDYSAYSNIILVRQDPSKDKCSWDSKWNQSDDLATPSSDLMYVTTSSDKGSPYSVYVDCDYYLFTCQWSNFDSNVTKTLMTKTDALNYSVTLDKENTNNEVYYMIVPSTVISEGTTMSTWNYNIFPTFSGSSDSNPYEVKFQTMSNPVVANSSWARWKIAGDNLAKFNISLDIAAMSWSSSPYRTATIGGAGYITYSNSEKCTISGGTAYKVSANNTSTVTLTEMDAATVWPENEGMIIGGTSGDNVTISAVAHDATATTIGTNYLVGNGNSSSEPSTGENVYVFSWDGSDPATVGFYKAATGTLAAHKAYLNLGRDSFNARDFLAFSFGDATGIDAVKGEKPQVGVFYTLAGQRIAQPTKGLYIMNGKKVIVK